MDEKPPKIRDDLIIQEIKGKDGSLHYVIKDPLTGAYFKVGEPERFIIRNFDGQKSTDEIAAAFKERFQIDLDPAEIDGFSGQLQVLCFLDNDLTRADLLKKQKDSSAEKPRTLFGKLMFVKIKAFNPGRLFDQTAGPLRFFFTRGFVIIAFMTIVFSFLLAIYNAKELGRDLTRLFNLEGLILVYLSILVVGMLHEFAHGLTCRHFGGKVHEIGFLIIYFQPAFYCNVSDAWLFPEKRKRLWVSFSGGFFQLFIWGLAVLVWRVTQTDILLNKTALAVMTFSGIHTLFNFNPLLRYDGYFLLSDYVEIPNLRTRARRYWGMVLKKLFVGEYGEPGRFNRREKRIYFYYGILSFVYLVFVLGYFLLKVEHYLVAELGGTGFIIFAAIMLLLIRNIIVDMARGIASLFKSGSGYFKRRKTFTICLLVLVVLVLISIFGRWELRVKGELELAPVQSLSLKYNSPGYAQLIYYNADQSSSDNQRQVSVFGGDYTTTTLVPLINLEDRVSKGQTIARLLNSETQHFIQDYSAQLAKSEEELTILKLGARPEEIAQVRSNLNGLEAQLALSIRNLERMNEMMEKKVISRKEWEDARTDSVVWDAKVKTERNKLNLLLAGARPEEIRAKEAEISQLKSQIEFHQAQEDFYEIKSPINGVVISLDTGEVVCEIAKLDTLEATIVLSEKELADITLGLPVKFKVRGYPSKTFYGTVFRIGRKVYVNHQDDRVFDVFCRVSNPDHILKPGMTGVANIYCGKRDISYLIYRKFFRTIKTEFWDWFDWW
nr:efflux RND transporter periplasmic adaptor subunit [candidate division Zixibacteria bacterium]